MQNLYSDDEDNSLTSSKGSNGEKSLTKKSRSRLASDSSASSKTVSRIGDEWPKEETKEGPKEEWKEPPSNDVHEEDAQYLNDEDRFE